MKKIEAIIQPVKFDNVKKKLFAIGVSGITISTVEGYGFQKRRMNVLDGKDVTVDLLPKVKIDIVVDDSEVEKVTEAIIDITRTGRIGDGKIFISDVSDVIRIRTGESGTDAL